MRLASIILALSAVSGLSIAAPLKIDPARLSEHVRVLASDEFKGRGPATRGEDLTIAYIIKQFQAAGLEPGGSPSGSGRTWTQDVPLARFAFDGPVGLTLSQSGQTRALIQGEDVAVRATMTGQAQTKLSDLPLVFVGYGVSAPERQWDDFKGVDLKGKIAVVLVNDPDFEAVEGDDSLGVFGGPAMTYYGRWTYKYEEAARRGASGLLIVHETAPAAYGWATVRNSNTGIQFDIVRADPSAQHAPIEGWIQRDVIAGIMDKAGLNYETLKIAARSRNFQPVSLGDARLGTDFKVEATHIVSHNVAGLLKGKGHPNETVIVSGHWDHLGVGPPDGKGDQIYNGAIDNGTGVAAILELARTLKAGKRPDRSIVFLTVTAEERGLLGSTYYGANPLYPLATTAGVINLDAMSAIGPTKDLTTSGSVPQTLQDDLARLLARKGRQLTPDPRPQAGLFYRSDHFPFAKVGVPAISIESGQDVIGVDAGTPKWSEIYTRDRYHQPSDEWSADMDFSGQVTDLTLVSDLISNLANSRTWPEWGPTAEFKAIRDRTASERSRR